MFIKKFNFQGHNEKCDKLLGEKQISVKTMNFKHVLERKRCIFGGF